MSTDPDGVDQQLDAGVADEQGLAPGSVPRKREVPPAAADADPRGDREKLREAVDEQAEEAETQEPPD